MASFTVARGGERAGREQIGHVLLAFGAVEEGDDNVALPWTIECSFEMPAEWGLDGYQSNRMFL